MDLGIVIPVVVALITAVVGFAQLRSGDRKSRRDDVQQIIDQLQEERNNANQRADEATSKHAAEMSELRTDLQKVVNRHRLLENYVAQLRSHIDLGLDPPAPPWPPELVT